MRRFTDPKYDMRLDFIDKHLQKLCSDNEEILVEADVGWKCPNDIYIYYCRVSNKKKSADSIHLDPSLMCLLSELAVETVLDELLWLWRSK
jgi:hypothetical protein